MPESRGETPVTTVEGMSPLKNGGSSPLPLSRLDAQTVGTPSPTNGFDRPKATPNSEVCDDRVNQDSFDGAEATTTRTSMEQLAEIATTGQLYRALNLTAQCYTRLREGALPRDRPIRKRQSVGIRRREPARRGAGRDPVRRGGLRFGRDVAVGKTGRYRHSRLGGQMQPGLERMSVQKTDRCLKSDCWACGSVRSRAHAKSLRESLLATLRGGWHRNCCQEPPNPCFPVR